MIALAKNSAKIYDDPCEPNIVNLGTSWSHWVLNSFVVPVVNSQLIWNQGTFGAAISKEKFEFGQCEAPGLKSAFLCRHFPLLFLLVMMTLHIWIC